ncbi:MAG: hypothetical protein PHE49_08660 [bacterium]|nr:hypothetical protein [bacterium]
MNWIKNILKQDVEPENTKQIIRWWEAKRLYYNLIMTVTGLLCVIIVLLVTGADLNRKEALSAMFFIIFYGISANVLYSSGWVIEILVRKNLKDTGIKKIGPLFFITGTTISVLLTLAFLILAIVPLWIKF